MMTSDKHSPAVVVSAYNRADSLQRLLRSLECAEYPERNVPLIISIDHGGDAAVIAIAEQFAWTHGEKRIIRHDERLGLKKHILKCGDLTGEYGSIILFEDDLFASPYYYDFASRCLQFYGDDHRIAGISLYSYDISENGFYPFVAVDDGADVYFMQVASSWGQAWTANQWNGFKEWFQRNPEMTKEEKPPAYLFDWNENSWKKHFIRYLHHNGKYFVYPRRSFTTNFEEPGATASTKGLYQVAIAEARHEPALAKFDDSKSYYDARFEMRAECLKKWLPSLQPYDFTVDLYGTLLLSNCQTPYLLTSKKAKDEARSFSMEMFPPALNVINEINGDGIKLVKKENVLPGATPSDLNYYKYKPVSEIIFKDELVKRIEKVYADYSLKIDALNQSHNEKTEALNREIRKLHEDYSERIARLHEDYAVKIPQAVDAALREYQFKLDYPQFALVTIAEQDEWDAVLKTVKSIQHQEYPRIRHQVIVVGKSGDMNLEALNSDRCTSSSADSFEEAARLAEAHFNHPESDYHCWLTPGTVLMPRAMITVREIFRRFAEVNWMKGLPVKAAGAEAAIPVTHGVDFRWDSNKFHNSSFEDIKNRLSRSGIFWKKHLWQNAGGNLNGNFPHVAEMELFKRFFALDFLYVALVYVAASGEELKIDQNAEKEFKALKKNFPKRSALRNLLSAASYPFFNQDVPYLRAVHNSLNNYPALIRFDHNARCLYFSEY